MNMRLFVLAGAMLVLPSAMADADHAIDPGAAPVESLPFEAMPVKVLPIGTTAPVQTAAAVATRETCTATVWLADEVRSVCTTRAVPHRRSDPALQGICITAYGRRTCY
jgi:hypothetical protein